MEIDFSTLFIAWSSIFIGSGLTYYFVNRYEKIKDKVKIKEQLVKEANATWQAGAEMLIHLSFQPTEVSGINKIVSKYNNHADYLEGLLLIYSENNEIVDMLIQLKSDLMLSINTQLKKIDLVKNTEARNEFTKNIRAFLVLIGKLKIKFNV